MTRPRPILIALLFLFAPLAPAFAATGAIVGGSATTFLCHDPACTSPSPSAVNFLPTQPASDAVRIDDTSGLSGFAWGAELGWINLHPTGAGVSLNAQTGVLDGLAWSQVSGWVNFNPSGPEGVVIDVSTGEFSGYAWTGGSHGGWIKFDCSEPSFCVKTTWRPTSSQVGAGSGGGSFTDYCSNIAGVQPRVPDGYEVNDQGECVPAPAPSEHQTEPGVSHTDEPPASSEPPESPRDACPNLPGTQIVTPKGFDLIQGACFPKKTVAHPAPAASASGNASSASGTASGGHPNGNGSDQATPHPGPVQAISAAIQASVVKPLSAFIHAAVQTVVQALLHLLGAVVSIFWRVVHAVFVFIHFPS